MLGFKDMMVLPSENEDDAYIKYRRMKHRKTDTTSESTDVDEALTMTQRLKKSRQMKRYKSKLKLGRERAMRKTADTGRIKRRASKHARMQLFKKLSKGKSPSELPFAKRQEIEKRLDKMKDRIERMAKKMVPQVRKLEKERKRAK